MRILLVDDDDNIVKVLNKVLQEQNYVVDVAKDGEAGWELVEGFQYDLVLLDVMLPKLDGISFCRRLREQKNQVLVMLLTARDTTTDKLLGLDSGADDYVVKPFNVLELAARIRALIRRGTTSASVILSCGDLRLDPNMHEVTYQGQVLPCSRKEYQLLELFLRNQKRVYSCREIVDHLWAFDAEPPNDSTVRSHIKNIRRELKNIGAADFLETVYGQGYRINPAFIAGSPQPVSTPNKQAVLENSLAEVWEQTKHLSIERFHSLEQAMSALKSGTFDAALHEQALQNAHKLAGSLGMFGFDQGSNLARQMENLLESGFESRSHLTPSAQQQFAQQLEPLMKALREVLCHSTGESSLTPITTVTPVSEPISAKILAVDDDLQILLALKNMLEPLGVTLTCLNNPENFWQTLRASQPDFLILDINMPQADGLELCQSIRQDPEWNWLPILFLTARTEPEVWQQAFITGADDYLNKPIVPQELSSRIRNRLQRIRTLRSQFKTDILKKLEQLDEN
ncbi:two component transcriptional regulator, winged helix family [Richelia sinica FACHB-800]|uniref:Two component transcriptional regulator, winged helix family n=1 Tax=Richelia sinica FACHB-800 TaxID=1357546 RepID=A0A975Y377_9NOST|nr:response regulator [Richelia sinica]MBD2663006.1 response regulator [Richelia sinica FACHB-800]QXE21856.1 two component transcriptional regulator, winged helix family [Richelia sinica FACHB-800]